MTQLDISHLQTDGEGREKDIPWESKQELGKKSESRTKTGMKKERLRANQDWNEEREVAWESRLE